MCSSDLKGRPKAPKGKMWDDAVRYWDTLRTDDGAHFDREVRLDAAKLPPIVTWGTSPEQVTSITGRVPAIAEGTTIDYRLHVGAVPIAWRSRIVDWRPGARFVDQQERGPYRSWYHEHTFRADGAATVMEDRVYYAPPFGLIGRLANRFFIVPTLRRIFQYRADVIRLRFGAS